jgi:hypothetical protein
LIKATIRQHYVPAGYLAQFTLLGRRDSRFFVHSFDGKVRQATPESIGFERHYHTIDISNRRPDHLEAIFHKIESPACALFKKLSESPGHELLESEKDTLLMFFSTQAARLPHSREKYNNLMLDRGRAFMEEVAHSHECFERAMEVAARHGIEVVSFSQDGLREAVDGGHIFPVVDRTQSAVGIFRLSEAILDALDGMHYTLWYSDGAAFVCSDYPVGLFYRLSDDDLLDDPMSEGTPTLTMLTDTIFMPLCRNVAVVFHRVEGVPLAQRANERMVAIVNSITISHARRFICSPTGDFVCVLPDRRLGNAKQAVNELTSFS